MSLSSPSFLLSLTSQYSQSLALATYFKFMVLLWLLTLLPIPSTVAHLTSKMHRHPLALYGASVAVLTLITMSCVLSYRANFGVETDRGWRSKIGMGDADRFCPSFPVKPPSSAMKSAIIEFSPSISFA